MTKKLIKNGTVWLEDRSLTTDVLVQDGLIADIGKVDYRIPDCEVIDAAGLHVLPGFIDIHTHLDDDIGGYRLADGWATGSEIALENGITTLCSFITQRTGQGMRSSVEASLKKAAGASICDYAFHLTPVSFTKDDWKCIEELAAEGFRTFKFYTTYRQAGLYLDYDSLKKAMGMISGMGLGALVHCEDDAILSDAKLKYEGIRSPFGHSASRPPGAEIEAVRRVLEIAGRTGCRTHVVHVSTAEAAELILRARQDLPLTQETCPQYLFLSDDKLRQEGGHRFICSPPLRDERDRSAMQDLAQRGGFDLYATDHCAFTKSDKDENSSDFTRVPGGLPGLGALVPLIWGLHGDPGSMARHLALNPAKTAGLYPRKGAIVKGADADLVVMNTEGEERAVRSSLSDTYEPYPGRKTRLEMKKVFLRGSIVVSEGKLVSRMAGVKL